MCALCGSFGTGNFAIAERPPVALAGLAWQGTFAEAADGVLRPLIARVRDAQDALGRAWNGPLVGLSRNDRPDGFSYFIGFGAKPDETVPDGFLRREVAGGSFASSWHGPQSGDVVAHFGRMIEWIGQQGLRREPRDCDQREEYPPHVDPFAAPSLRILLPVAALAFPQAAARPGSIREG